ncbi:MAG: RidA family protein [Rhodospirillaceae bacterium]
MISSIQNRLKELGLILPKVEVPVANYLPYTQSGSLIHVSGQLPTLNGALIFTGKVNGSVSIEQGIECARQCAINIVSQVNAACDGDLDRVTSIIRITGYVASPPSFTNHPQIVNGASDCLVSIFGDKGRHTRVAIGCSSLPLDAPVEVDAVFEVS